jgi:hypothetical protein
MKRLADALEMLHALEAQCRPVLDAWLAAPRWPLTGEVKDAMDVFLNLTAVYVHAVEVETQAGTISNRLRIESKTTPPSARPLEGLGPARGQRRGVDGAAEARVPQRKP